MQQVKLHGQRIELGEIESALDINPRVTHALVALPQTGRFAKRLVAILSLKDVAPIGTPSSVCQIVTGGDRGTAARLASREVKNSLAEYLPTWMIPSTFIIVEELPLLSSGKLDRRGVATWLADVDAPIYDSIMEADEENEDTVAATETTILLQQIIAQVLDLPLHKTKLGSSFLNLGGDSLSAMVRISPHDNQIYRTTGLEPGSEE